MVSDVNGGSCLEECRGESVGGGRIGFVSGVQGSQVCVEGLPLGVLLPFARVLVFKVSIVVFKCS